jgi:tetratricopeptide (TPR) repeat protein
MLGAVRLAHVVTLVVIQKGRTQMRPNRIALVIILTAATMTALGCHGQSVSAKSATEQSQSSGLNLSPSSTNSPVVPGIYNPPEMQRPAKPYVVPDANTLATYKDFLSVVDNKNGSSSLFSATSLPALNKLIQDHPEFAGGYYFRGIIEGCNVDQPQLERAKADLELALSKEPNGNIMGDKDSKSDDSGTVYSLLAKIAYAQKDYTASLNLLEKVIKQKDLTDATKSLSEFSDPSSSHHFCDWNIKDIYELQMAAPHDWRPLVLEGIFFSPQFADQNKAEKNSQATTAFQKAALLYPKIALIPFFQGQLASHEAFMNPSDAAQEAAYRKSLPYYGKAISLDSNFEAAYSERAEALSSLKEYAEAVKDYTVVLSLNPKNDAAYNDRGLAYFYSGEYPQAISDFSHALPFQVAHHDSYLDNLYQNRANAYSKLREYRLAIEDYSSAIALMLEGQLTLGNISEFRAMYPEYDTISNDILLPKLHERFVPDLKFSDFKNATLNNKPWHPSFILTDLYKSRADAYFAVGDYIDGILDIHRHEAGIDAEYRQHDIWHLLSGTETGSSGSEQYLINAKTSQPQARPFPVVYLRTMDDGEENIDQRLELDCSNHKVKSDPPDILDEHGKPLSRTPQWSVVEADSVEEDLWNGVCHGRQLLYSAISDSDVHR